MSGRERAGLLPKGRQLQEGSHNHQPGPITHRTEQKIPGPTKNQEHKAVPHDESHSRSTSEVKTLELRSESSDGQGNAQQEGRA